MSAEIISSSDDLVTPWENNLSLLRSNQETKKSVLAQREGEKSRSVPFRSIIEGESGARVARFFFGGETRGGSDMLWIGRLSSGTERSDFSQPQRNSLQELKQQAGSCRHKVSALLLLLSSRPFRRFVSIIIPPPSTENYAATDDDHINI